MPRPDPVKGPQARATAVTERTTSDQLQNLVWRQIQQAEDLGNDNVSVNRTQLATLMNYIEDLEGALMKANDDVDGTTRPPLRPRE